MNARLGVVFENLQKLLPGVTFGQGVKSLYDEPLTPRIVWIPTEEHFAPASKNPVRPRPLHTRLVGIDAHLWADTLEDVEVLLNNLIFALHRYTQGQYELRTCSWEPPMWLERGEACRLSFFIALPIGGELETMTAAHTQTAS